MNEDPSRRRAVPPHDRPRISARFVLVCTAVLATAAMVGASIDVSPADGATSPRYERLWNNLGKKHKRWARRTSMCESGGVRNIHGGGGRYHGAFQFSLPTWRSSPKSPGGDPHRKSWRTQAVVAVYLKKRDGAKTHWPHCG